VAKLLVVAGLISFIAALIAEVAFIMLRLTTASGSTTASPTSTMGLTVWGLIGLGILCWMIAAAIVLVGHFRNRV
jgi:hypothetical protein